MRNFLLSRIDNIGDVVLTFFMAYEIKQRYPDSKVFFLARDYVKDVVNQCQYIDYYLSYSDLIAKSSNKAAAYLQAMNLDAFIHVSPNKKLASLAKKANIPVRVGVYGRWYHWLYCNKILFYNRSSSNLHESQLNLKLLKPFNIDVVSDLSDLQDIKLIRDQMPLTSKVNKFIDNDKFNLIVHPFSNGNGREWPICNFKNLLANLDADKFNLILTGSQAEANKIEKFCLNDFPHTVNTAGRLSLAELIQLIESANGLIASATGPLHIADVIGTKCIGLFSQAPNASTNRWGLIGKKSIEMVSKESCDESLCTNLNCACMLTIQVESVIKNIHNWL